MSPAVAAALAADSAFFIAQFPQLGAIWLKDRDSRRKHAKEMKALEAKRGGGT